MRRWGVGRSLEVWKVILLEKEEGYWLLELFGRERVASGLEGGHLSVEEVRKVYEVNIALSKTAVSNKRYLVYCALCTCTEFIHSKSCAVLNKTGFGIKYHLMFKLILSTQKLVFFFPRCFVQVHQNIFSLDSCTLELVIKHTNCKTVCQ